MKEIKVSYKQLETFLCELFLKSSMNENDASYAAKCLVKTNLWGIDSHGVLRMPIYLKRLLAKVVNPNPNIKMIKDDGSVMALYDADSALGYISGRFGMNLAIEKAKKYGISFILIKNSNHYGAASLYTTEAAKEGLIGISTTNVIPNIGMKGNKKPSVGNNPIAMAAPIGGDFPFSLDISLSSVSGGKLLLAAKKGEKIPKDWAVTKEGFETDNPQLGFDGFLLPMGLHKGFGLALFVDLITGVLSGSAFLKEIKSMYKFQDDPSLTTHMFSVIDPTYFIGKEVYQKNIEEWKMSVYSTEMVDASQRQIIPGEIEYNTEKARKKDGIPIPNDLKDELLGVAKNLDVDASFLK